MTENAMITAKQERFIAALLAGNTISVAALACKINQSTGYRWMKQAAFQEAYKAARKQVFDQELSSLVNLVSKAIKALERNLEGDEVPPNTQVRSAQVVLELARDIITTAEVEDRLQLLESLLAHSDVTPRGQ